MTDPLNISVSLADVETSIPLLPEGEYVMQIADSTVEPNKAKTGMNWKLKLVTVAKATAVDGREVNPNFPVFTVCALQPSEKATDPDGYKRQIAQTVDAIFAIEKGTPRPNFDGELVKAAIGKQVVARLVQDIYEGNTNNKVKAMKAYVG